MASVQSYTITVQNNLTEKEGLDYLLTTDRRFIFLDKENRKTVMEALGIDKKYSRAFDLLYIEGRTDEQQISLENTDAITLAELKTTQKKLSSNPQGFFFGATQNEFELATLFGDRYKFCFVSLHKESLSHTLLTLAELEPRIKTKRVQYQINL